MNKKIWIIIISIILAIFAFFGYFMVRAMTAQVLYGAPLFRPNK